MTHFTDMTGLASNALAITAALFLLPGVTRLHRRYLALLAGITFAVALFPFGGLPPAAYVRGVIGDLSITSLVLLMLNISRPLFDWRQPGTQSGFALQLLIAIAAVGLYPFALGLCLFDPYRLGYGSPWFLGILLTVALGACLRQIHVAALCIALAVFAWSIGWYESNNLWDYLLDPLVSAYAIAALARHGLMALKKQ